MYMRIKKLLFSTPRKQRAQTWGASPAKQTDIHINSFPFRLKRMAPWGLGDIVLRTKPNDWGGMKAFTCIHQEIKQAALPFTALTELERQKRFQKAESCHGFAPFCQWMASQLPKAAGSQSLNTNRFAQGKRQHHGSQAHTQILYWARFYPYLHLKTSTSANYVNSNTHGLKIKLYSSFR